MSGVTGILLCAGGSTRMGFNKLLTPIAGKTAIERSAEALIAGGATELVLTVSDATRAFAESLSLSVPVKVVSGGAERRDSVRLALKEATGEICAIHDAARCLVSPDTVRASIDSAKENGSGIVALSVTDTVFLSEGGALTRLDRDKLLRMQTPQTFMTERIRAAYENRSEEAQLATDDCTLYALAGYTPAFVPGSEDNFKLTRPEDFARATRMFTRYGTGFDTHRLTEGRKLILGGVDIPFEKGLLGHSDADVLTHAVMDAYLGAAGLPEIGHHFPDTDPAYEGADSMELLKKVRVAIEQKGLRMGGFSAVIIAQRPKMAPHLEAMRARFSEVTGVAADEIALAATTTEGMNDEGRGLCISASAVASVK